MRRAVEALDSEDLFLSVISIGEIAKGIALLKEAKKKDDLRIWIQALENHYADRVLIVDLETSYIWGELTVEAQKAGKIVPARDGLIVSTARRHGLCVMTRNTEHFKAAGFCFSTRGPASHCNSLGLLLSKSSVEVDVLNPAQRDAHSVFPLMVYINAHAKMRISIELALSGCLAKHAPFCVMVCNVLSTPTSCCPI